MNQFNTFKSTTTFIIQINYNNYDKTKDLIYG